MPKKNICESAAKPGSDGDHSATEQTHQELRDAQGHVEVAIQLP